MTQAEFGPALTFDHVGIVVRDIEQGCEILTGTLGPLRFTRAFDDAGLGVTVQFALDAAGVTYELIAPYGADSVVQRTLLSGHNLLNQIAYRTTSLDASVRRLRAQHYAVPVSAPRPAIAFGGAPVQFLVSRLGFVIELIEADQVLHRFR